MTTLLKALAAASDGLVVPVRKTGKMCVDTNTSRGTIEVDERYYLICKDNTVHVKCINNYDTYMVDENVTLYEMSRLDIFGKPLAIGNPKACFIDNKSSFIEFLNLATHKPNEIKNLLVGFVVDEKMYTYDYDLSVYDINSGEEKDIRNENIPVSLLSETGNLVFINAGEIHTLDELDFNMLKEFGMC